MTGRSLSDAGIAAPKNVARKMSFKRNQIETAIAHMYDPGCQEPPPELRTRIKRLLELDRSRGRKLRATDAEEANFAFFNEEAPGTGADISFSQYEAFAVLNALRIMDHGWPQGFAVSIMRRIRPDLEKEHARILRQPPEKLFDWQVIRARARPGDIAVDNTDPVFIVLATPIRRSPDEAQTAPASAVCHGWDRVREFSRNVSSVSLFEVVTLAHKLRAELFNSKPKSRGRVPSTAGPV
jgi:hypothetical protein